jgi:hypothetical protein
VRFVVSDEVDDWQEGLRLAELVVSGPADAVRMARKVAEWEGLLWASGGLLGGGEHANGAGASTGAAEGRPEPSAPGGAS